MSGDPQGIVFREFKSKPTLWVMISFLWNVYFWLKMNLDWRPDVSDLTNNFDFRCDKKTSH